MSSVYTVKDDLGSEIVIDRSSVISVGRTMPIKSMLDANTKPEEIRAAEMAKRTIYITAKVMGIIKLTYDNEQKASAWFGNIKKWLEEKK